MTQFHGWHLTNGLVAWSQRNFIECSLSLPLGTNPSHFHTTFTWHSYAFVLNAFSCLHCLTCIFGLKSVPSSWGSFVGLSPQTKLQAPQIEIWNTVNQWSFFQFLECQVPCTNAKPLYWKRFGDGSASNAFHGISFPMTPCFIVARILFLYQWLVRIAVMRSWK